VGLGAEFQPPEARGSAAEFQPPEARGSAADPPGTATILQPFFSKKYSLLGIFWPKFLLKNSFLNI